MSELTGVGLVAGYGATPILNGCTVAARPGELAVIVGPNGAGKSTAMKALLGLLPITSGTVQLDSRDLAGFTPQKRVAAGIGFVPQNQNVFVSLTVQENLEMGSYLNREGSLVRLDEVYALFPDLRDKRNQSAGELSGGQRQQVAVGRALMARPSVLMLDEPTAGVSPRVCAELLERILSLRDTGLAIMMVEQNARQALQIANVGYVLVNGQNRFTGSGPELLADDEVRRTFLGG